MNSIATALGVADTGGVVIRYGPSICTAIVSWVCTRLYVCVSVRMYIDVSECTYVWKYGIACVYVCVCKYLCHDNPVEQGSHFLQAMA